MTRILLVEDKPDLAFGLKTSLEIEGYDVDVADDGIKGLDHARSTQPDLVILDLMLPGIDGYEVLRQLRSGGHNMPVLVLTARGDETDKVVGFRLGADDYVTKPFSLSELIARVEALLRRASVRSDSAAPGGRTVERFGTVVVDPGSHAVTRDGHAVALTPKEFSLLMALLERRGRVATRLELLREVWGHQVEVMTRTVDIHIAELRRKLEADPANPRYILTVWKAGYRLDPNPIAVANAANDR